MNWRSIFPNFIMLIMKYPISKWNFEKIIITIEIIIRFYTRFSILWSDNYWEKKIAENFIPNLFQFRLNNPVAFKFNHNEININIIITKNNEYDYHNVIVVFGYDIWNHRIYYKQYWK